ncbi:hypothetical protein ABBQ38_003341 [Trebouxia sp. C0009 RCD-2024]
MGRTSPLPSAQLPSPFHHNKDWEQYGLKASLEHQLWEVLKHHAKGLMVPEIEKSLDGGSDTSKIVSVLEESFYFFALAEGKWCLAVYQPLRWGFAGTGKIAEDFIEALSLVPGAELMTAAARKKDRLPQAQEFAKKHGVMKAVEDYEALAKDPDVDIVYVSNIHPAHKDASILMMNNGKHVLCEKPLAVNASVTREMIAKAQETGVFFSAALWTRFFPAIQTVRTLIQSGMIGKVHHFHGAFIAEMSEDIERIYDPTMGGGALLDIGIYPLSIASWVFGRQTPQVVSAMGMVHPRGVDALGMVNLKYSQTEFASITFGICMASSPVEGTVHGTKGSIKLHNAMHCPTKISVQLKGEEPWVLEFPPPEKPESINHGAADGFNFPGGIGFVYEAMGVHSAVINGKKQVEDIGRDEMIMLMEVSDRIREQLGTSYPQDGPLQKFTAAMPSVLS